jgi:tetratricopeptide (TPR) repeat protein
MGKLYHTIEQYDEALKLYQESLDITKRNLDTYGIASNLFLIGNVLVKQGKYTKALPYSLIGYIILKKLGHKEETIIVQQDLDSIKYAIGDEEFKKRAAEIELKVPEEYH